MAEIYACPEVAAIREFYLDIFERGWVTDSIHDVLASQSQRVFDAHQAGNSVVTPHLRSWSKDFLGLTAAQCLEADLSLDQARNCIAREYGFDDWSAVVTLGTRKVDTDFEHSVDCVITGDVSLLVQALNSNPALTAQISGFGHASTLLHYIAANGVETQRQITPMNAAEITEVLISAGADVNAEANMYGGGSRTLGLLLTSAHPGNAGVTDAVAQILKAAGAT